MANDKPMIVRAFVGDGHVVCAVCKSEYLAGWDEVPSPCPNGCAQNPVEEFLRSPRTGESE